MSQVSKLFFKLRKLILTTKLTVGLDLEKLQEIGQQFKEK